MVRYVGLLVVLFIGLQQGLASEQVSVHVPANVEPCVAWGKTRLEESLAGVGYDLQRDAERTIEISVDPKHVQERDTTRGPDVDSWKSR